MVTHIVLMKFKEGRDKDADIARACDALRGMVGKVEVLRHLEVGPNCVPSAHAFDLALVTRFDDLAGLSSYAQDPRHLVVKDFITTMLVGSYVVDYESP